MIEISPEAFEAIKEWQGWTNEEVNNWLNEKEPLYPIDRSRNPWWDTGAT